MAVRREGTGTVLIAEAEAVTDTVASMMLGTVRFDVEVTGAPPVVGRRYRISGVDLELFDCRS